MSRRVESGLLDLPLDLLAKLLFVHIFIEFIIGLFEVVLEGELISKETKRPIGSWAVRQGGKLHGTT